jgi:5'-3' exonuclease
LNQKTTTEGSFLIIDGSSVLVRAYFASAHSGRLMQSSRGVYTNAVFGFLNMMFRMIEQVRPTHLFVAWDVSRDTFRRELYPAYKGTRGELPDALHPQFTTMQDVLEAIGVVQHADDRYEADDIIGTMSQRAAIEGHRVLILTGDRDALQLVDERVTVAIMKKGITEMDLYTPQFLMEQWGLTAQQIIDLKGLMGDSSDNIPGVPGIGEKTAKKLLYEFHSIENLLENTHQLKGKVKERLDEHRELALLSKKLATICLDVPLQLMLEECKLSFHMERAREKFSELELHRAQTLLERVLQVG